MTKKSFHLNTHDLSGFHVWASLVRIKSKLKIINVKNIFNASWEFQSLYSVSSSFNKEHVFYLNLLLKLTKGKY